MGELGRTTYTISLSDFFASNSRNHVFAAIDSSGNELWHTMRSPLWQGFTHSRFSLNGSQFSIHTTNPQSAAVIAPVNTPSNKTGLLRESGGNKFYRVYGGPANFSFSPVTPTNRATMAAAVAGGEREATLSATDSALLAYLTSGGAVGSALGVPNAKKRL